MQLVFVCLSNKLINVLLFLAIINCIGDTKASTDDASKVEQAANKTPVVAFAQKSVKKELKVQLPEEAVVEITPSQAKDDHTKEPIIIRDDKTATEVNNKKVLEKTVEKIATITEPITLRPQHHQHLLDEDFVLKDEDTSESLKAGFYFFLILSSGAILFIVFKIYRLRLSRAERKYGVQGDRSTQELTPLPVSIEDGHSDDEDQTLFDIQRQNIRIL